MALDQRKSEDRHKITDNTKLTRISQSFEGGKHLELDAFPAEGAILFQIQKINEDVKEIHRYLGSEVTSNTATNLSVTANGTSLTVNSSDGTNASIPAATTNAWGAMTDENFDAIAANTAKNTNVSTNLSVTARDTALTINSSDGTDASLPAATATAWGVMTDDYLRDLATASIAPPAEGSYGAGATAHHVWIPGTRFYGSAATYDEGVAKVTDRATTLYYDFAGIDRKKVTHVHAFTSTAVSTGLTVKRWRGTHGVSYATLANRVATNTSQNITDWTCAVSEQLNIAFTPRATTIALHGVLLTLARV
tara:strand:- start:174 stop:1097 length:924 start_codon:yes stop_codon:yes gene_type:complete